MADIAMATCTRCRETKPVAAFARSKGRPKGMRMCRLIDLYCSPYYHCSSIRNSDPASFVGPAYWVQGEVTHPEETQACEPPPCGAPPPLSAS